MLYSYVVQSVIYIFCMTIFQIQIHLYHNSCFLSSQKYFCGVHNIILTKYRLSSLEPGFNFVLVNPMAMHCPKFGWLCNLDMQQIFHTILRGVKQEAQGPGAQLTSRQSWKHMRSDALPNLAEWPWAGFSDVVLNTERLWRTNAKPSSIVIQAEMDSWLVRLKSSSVWPSWDSAHSW
jgi:hypothetical protein